MKIAIVDNIGLPYDGTTLSKSGLGGSESAVILISKELANLGHEVFVFNNCVSENSAPGIYDDVRYIPFETLAFTKFEVDILISSRTLIPLVPEKYYSRFMPDQYGRMHAPHLFRNIEAKHKVLWKHDTFAMADDILEEMVVDGYIDEIFTLSDFHSAYIATSNHGKQRVYEVLKDKIFHTRNGVVNYIPEVDIRAKDRDLFVYNASVSKGMVPLVEKIWPEIKRQIPSAKLKIIGGYYKGIVQDEQEIKYHQLAHDNNGIEFTGVIRQSEIAEILAKASFFLFPGAFPETFGISSLESITYNTPLIATNFGALNETALKDVSYFMDYAIQPTPLSGWIDEQSQITKFVELTVNAYNNTYLHQQKMYACNKVKEVTGWDSVAVQWNQHFHKVLNKHFPLEDFRRAKKINTAVHRLFGRRNSNPEEWGHPKNPEQHIDIVVPFFNASDYIYDCIDSIASQDYDNYNCILIDDASTNRDYLSIYQYLVSRGLTNKFKLIVNDENVGAVKNQITTIRQLDDESIVVLLDGDDQFVNDNTILDFINNLYDGTTDFSYGSMWSVADNIPLIAQPYPEAIRKSGEYRSYKFNWGLPYTHLRTFRKALVTDIPDEEFMIDGSWVRAGGDNATFYSIIERADPSKIKCVSEVLVQYNDLNPLNDYKVNDVEQYNTATHIAKPKNPPKKKILIAIPTNKYVSSEVLRSIYELKSTVDHDLDFQYFFGYDSRQIYNLMAKWATNYDLTLFVAPDYIVPPNIINEIIDTGSDLVVISPGTFAAKPGIFTTIVQYPWFTTNITDPNGMDDFVKSVGPASVTYFE